MTGELEILVDKHSRMPSAWMMLRIPAKAVVNEPRIADALSK